VEFNIISWLKYLSITIGTGGFEEFFYIAILHEFCWLDNFRIVVVRQKLVFLRRILYKLALRGYSFNAFINLHFLLQGYE